MGSSNKNPIKVLVINQFASPPDYGSGAGERHFFLANSLTQRGFDFTILTGSSNHLLIKKPNVENNFSQEIISGVKIVWVKLKEFRSDSNIKRVILWFQFLHRLFFYDIEKNKPDLVLVSSMSILPSLYAIYLKRKYQIPFILEIRDIWPLTAYQLGGYSKLNPLMWFLARVEKLAYKHSDYIISVMPGFETYLSDFRHAYKCKILWIPNAIPDHFEKYNNSNEVVLKKKGFNVLYAGSLGVANAMDIIIEAARLIKGNKDIYFNIIGNGPNKEKLQNESADLSNVMFYPKINKQNILPLIRQADLCIISWRDLGIYKYGVSANKYNDYMLAGKPILSASRIPDDPVTISESGIKVNPENPIALAEAILHLKSLPVEELNRMGRNGYNYVIKNNTYKVISEKYEVCFREALKD